MTEIPEDVKLVVGLMGAMQAQTGSVNWSLICGLTISERKYHAQLSIVRDEVMRLMDGAYMPNPRAVTNALFPGEAAVEEWLTAHFSGDWRDPATPFMRCWSCWECAA